MSSRKRTPDKETPKEETATAVAEPPAAEAQPEGKSFAERVGQKKWTAAPDPFGIASDYAAGVHLFDSKRDRQIALKFDEKPPQVIIDKVKEAGCHWQQDNQIWALSYGDSPLTVRIEGERLYQDVRQMLRTEKGIEASPEVPF